jgi:hypothetical protein
MVLRSIHLSRVHVMEKGFVEKAILIIVVGYLASKLIYPLLDSTVGRFLRLA